jgi:CubicO group peptidase (beta-lactamase class C family)
MRDMRAISAAALRAMAMRAEVQRRGNAARARPAPVPAIAARGAHDLGASASGRTTVRARVASAAVIVAAVALFGCNHAPRGAPAGDHDFARFDQVIRDALRDLDLEGAAAVVVHRARGIVHVQGYGTFDEDRVFLIASASKPLSAGVLLRLADRGLLDLDAPIGAYVGDAWGDGKAELTVAQLISNSSGLPGLLDRPESRAYRCQYRPAGSLTECARAIYQASDEQGRLPPDERFRYGGAQWQLAGGIAEVVTGRSWQSLVHETYVATCGASSLGYTNQFGGSDRFRYPDWFDGDTSALPVTDNPSIEAGAYVTVEDYGRILLMHLRGGTCGDSVALSSTAVRRMQLDRIAHAYGGSTPSRQLQGYGLGWWIDRDAAGVVASPGLYGAIPWLDTARGYGAFIAIEASAREREQILARARPVLDAMFGGTSN